MTQTDRFHVALLVCCVAAGVPWYVLACVGGIWLFHSWAIGRKP